MEDFREECKRIAEKKAAEKAMELQRIKVRQ